HVALERVLECGLETQSLQGEAARGAAALVHLHRLRHGGGHVAPHALCERALTREAEGKLHTRPVQRITAEPQVSPAPMPVIRIVSPLWTRPVETASASASGIEADEVLP